MASFQVLMQLFQSDIECELTPVRALLSVTRNFSGKLFLYQRLPYHCPSCMIRETRVKSGAN